MKLTYSASSPFVRKIRILIQCLKLKNEIEEIPSAANPLKRDPRITQYNPLGKVPVLIIDDKNVLMDSKLIAEYLCSYVPDNTLLPVTGPERWKILRNEFLADGILDAALLIRYETGPRPKELQWQEWCDAQMEKITATLQVLNDDCMETPAPLNLGTISISCALEFLDFRFESFDWRHTYPQLAKYIEPIFDLPELRSTSPLPNKA